MDYGFRQRAAKTDVETAPWEVSAAVIRPGCICGMAGARAQTRGLLGGVGYEGVVTAVTVEEYLRFALARTAEKLRAVSWAVGSLLPLS